MSWSNCVHGTKSNSIVVKIGGGENVTYHVCSCVTFLFSIYVVTIFPSKLERPVPFSPESRGDSQVSMVTKFTKKSAV